MRLTFMGANRQVTGSRYCLEVNDSRLMIDCGLTQEREFLSRNWEPCPIAADTFQSMLLTHIHVDHSGLIPKFVREGFQGSIFATRPTADLAEIVLRDSAHIQEEDAAFKAKRHRREKRKGRFPEIPLYTTADAEQALNAFYPVDYHQPISVADGVDVVFHDAGHILGSAMLELRIQEDGKRRRLIFSGDIGQWGKPLIGDPSVFKEADYVVMESTYGDSNHEKSIDVETQMSEIIHRTVERGGNVVIPTFAIERAQELMYHIGRLVYADRIPDIPIILDSPMAVDVTEIFYKHRQYLDEETRQLTESGQPPLRYQGLRLVQSVEDSKALADLKEPCVIMSTAGMCNAGRIKHHLRNNIVRPECSILFVGYQAHGTLGRQIVEGSPQVRIHGDIHPVRASIERIDGLSAHADQSGLLRWLSNLQSAPRQIFLTHGEETGATSLAEKIRESHGWPVTIPNYMETAPLE